MRATIPSYRCRQPAVLRSSVAWIRGSIRFRFLVWLEAKPWWSLESFKDPYIDVAQSMKRLELTPFIPYKDNIRGFVYDVKTGMINEVLAGNS